MHLITTTTALQSKISEFKQTNQAIVLVPTMGALHDGHISLVKLAHSTGAKVFVSIFPNPAQFNEKKDFEAYPKTVEADCALLDKVGTHCVFAPATPAEIYGDGFQSWVNVDQLSLPFEGASRPGHFKGVATVVAILFNLFRPDFATFGEKDFQQLRLVEQMVNDLKISVKIIRAPIIREAGGLAMSSRNARLSVDGKNTALALSRGLRIASDAFFGGERRGPFLRSLVLDMLATERNVGVDYVAVVDEETLKEVDRIEKPARVLVAATVDGVRLIDNVSLAANSDRK